MCNRTHYSFDAKLRALRASDPYREWNSLDDKRVCILCQREITGRQIGVVKGRARHRFKVRCPTDNCPSTPREWVYPGSPYASEKAWNDWRRAIGDEAGPHPQRDEMHRVAA